MHGRVIQVDQAIKLYRECVRLRPSWAEGWWYLGTLLYDKDSFADARATLTHFVKIEPNGAPAWALLGLMSMRPALTRMHWRV